MCDGTEVRINDAYSLSKGLGRGGRGPPGGPPGLPLEPGGTWFTLNDVSIFHSSCVHCG